MVSSQGGTSPQGGSPPEPCRTDETAESVARENRRLPVGAELHDDIAHFRVSAPRRRRVEVVFAGLGESRTLELDDEGDGYFSGQTKARAGERYRFRLDGEDTLFPDPASRSQPEGPHGPSELIDPAAFQWRDSAWLGPTMATPVNYEMHIGSFTPEGTWQAAAAHLPELVELGVTLLEVMPVAAFPGRFGWGYDGVDLFAPTHLYGTPDDFRRFVDSAHQLGLGVILDVVYNHVGPDGNFLTQFTDTFFTDRYACEWGEAINFDGDGSDSTREFILANATYWIDEFHLDGLRLDATQQIFDASPVHILAELGQVTRELATKHRRHIYLVCENEPQDCRLVRPIDQGGFELDALWNDDFHHCSLVAATGQNRAYLSGYTGSPQEFVSIAKYGFLYQGQRCKWQGKRRGTPTFDIAPPHLVHFIQNHDQVANTGSGERLHQLTSFGVYKALSTLCLLLPGTPMLFQGQEFAASSPFTFFADHKPELAKLVREGRTEFLSQFPNLASQAMAASLPDPGALENFRRCILDHSERHHGQHAQVLDLHRDLIRLRRSDPVIDSPSRRKIDGAVLSDGAFVLRWFGHTDRLLLVNLGHDLRLESPAEPLLAPPIGASWRDLWSSEDIRYGGRGTPPIETDEHWFVPAQAAILLRSVGGGTLPPARETVARN
jgi:maltooligosyltrehalose trehalohydrolase